MSDMIYFLRLTGLDLDLEGSTRTATDSENDSNNRRDNKCPDTDVYVGSSAHGNNVDSDDIEGGSHVGSDCNDAVSGQAGTGRAG